MDARKTKEDRIQLDMQALKNMDVPNLSQAAKIFDVPRRTLGDRIYGMPSSDIRQQAQQRLSVQEEESIARAIYTLTRWGWGGWPSQWGKTAGLTRNWLLSG